METLPGHVSITFILTVFLTVGFLFYAVKISVFQTAAAKTLIFLVGFGLFFQMMLARGGFYQATGGLPPRVMLTGVFPALLTILLFFLFARQSLIDHLPLKILTLLHVVRIPVELVLLWLFREKLVPVQMTFEGWNFDILIGLSAPVVVWLGFRGKKINRPLLIGWHLIGLGFLLNIVTIAVLSFPFPLQQFAFNQPNRAIIYFPFIWLPTIVVPIVLFSHLVCLRQLLKR